MTNTTLQPQPGPIFVTGTDTGVGKTLTCAALLRGLRGRGIRACGMKPIAAGATLQSGVWRNEDVDTLLEAGIPGLTQDRICPYLLKEPASPHIAAQLERVAIDIRRIQDSFTDLCRAADVVVVEGSGGWFCPVSLETTFADLALTLGLPVLMVVGLRLGCINHALLTARAIRASGLPLVGWIANHAAGGMHHAAENIAAISHHIAAPLWTEIGQKTEAERRLLTIDWRI
jgi:dethiobiotin synthetase